MPVAAQNRITRSCAVNGVVTFANGYSRRQLLANAAIAASRIGSYRELAQHGQAQFLGLLERDGGGARSIVDPRMEVPSTKGVL
jgi:hypothetical protein